MGGELLDEAYTSQQLEKQVTHFYEIGLEQIEFIEETTPTLEEVCTIIKSLKKGEAPDNEQIVAEILYMGGISPVSDNSSG